MHTATTNYTQTKAYVDCIPQIKHKGIKPVVVPFYFLFFWVELSACPHVIFPAGEEGDRYLTSISSSGLNVPLPLAGFIIFSAKLSCQ